MRRKSKRGFHVVCPKCHRSVKLEAYAVAQLSMGHSLKGYCENKKCGVRHYLIGDPKKVTVEAY